MLPLRFRPALEILGASAGFEDFFEDGASSTRMETSPMLISLGSLSCLSKNRNLFDFFGMAN